MKIKGERRDGKEGEKGLLLLLFFFTRSLCNSCAILSFCDSTSVGQPHRLK